MNNNDNKLDILTKKIYEEGIEKAQNDAKEILEKARKDADSTANIASTGRMPGSGLVSSTSLYEQRSRNKS